MATTVSDFVIDRIQAWGVSRVFGFPGDGIGEFDGAMGKAERSGHPFKYVRPTHEEICALMATAHAKFTGEVGVCVATSSPGAFHMLNGLYDAAMDNQPVVAIVGQQGLDSFGTFTQQESNLERTFADVACYVQTIVSPQQAQAVVDTAFRTARTRLQPAVIIFPHDVQGMKMQEPQRKTWVSRSSSVAPSTEITPGAADLRRAAEILNAGKKVAMLVGHGAKGATDEVLEVAKLTGAGIMTALRGKQVVPADVPYHTQQLGLLGSRPSLHMVKECDTLLMLGTNYPYAQFLPETGQARAVQVDLRPEQMGLRYPTEVNLWGDVKTTLKALIPLLHQTDDLSFQNSLAGEMREWDAETERQAMVRYERANPRRVYFELNKRLPPQAIVTCDAGTTADWYGHHIKLRNGMMGDLSGRLASMLAAMPYATAAKFAYPERCVVCTIGDGAFQMLGMNELITVKKYQQEWGENKQLIIVVLHNDDLTQVSWEMRTEDGNPLWDTSQDVETMDYAGYARLLGFQGVAVHSDDEIPAAMDQAFAYKGVTLIDAYVSKDVPPIPAHISAEYAINTGKALLKGDPQEGPVIVDSAKALVSEGVSRVKGLLHIGQHGADKHGTDKGASKEEQDKGRAGQLMRPAPSGAAAPATATPVTAAPVTLAAVTALHLSSYRVPTETFGERMAETDGTARWDSTGVLVVRAEAGGMTGLGYAYTDPAAALELARGTLAGEVLGHSALGTNRAFWSMAGAARNLGWSGVAASAISALDIALHDLKARLLDTSLTALLGGARDHVTAYGSGGFTSYTAAQLQRQLSEWAGEGLRAVKMKIGSDPDADLGRVRAARAAVGPGVQLFVDANGAYSRKEALGMAARFADLNVTWFEEPVSSDDLPGLGMQIAAGEYGYAPAYFHAMLAAGAVDTLQADATRCGGVSGFLLAAAQAQGAGVPISAHTSPAIHASICAALTNVVHVEDFHDHRRIEGLFFSGVPERRGGQLRPGHGLEFLPEAAKPYLLREASVS